MYVPYLLEDAKEEVNTAVERCPHARTLELARSRKGRPVSMVRIKTGVR